MTRAIDATLLTALANEEQPTCWLMEIAMPDGSYRRCSNLGSADITVDGDTFAGFPGFDMSSVTFSDGDGAPAADLAQPIGSIGPITFLEAAQGLVSGLAVRLWACNYEIAKRHEIGSKWYIGRIETDESGLAVFEVKCTALKNRQLFLRRWQPKCQHHLGDSGCGKDLTAFTHSATVVSVIDLFTLVVTISSPPADDYFNHGAIQFDSGDLANTAYDIRDWDQASGTVYLAQPLKGTPAASDTISMHAGCDKTDGAAGCARFDNVLRYFGFPNLPDENLSLPADQYGESAPAAPQPATGSGVFAGIGGGPIGGSFI